MMVSLFGLDTEKTASNRTAGDARHGFADRTSI